MAMCNQLTSLPFKGLTNKTTAQLCSQQQWYPPDEAADPKLPGE